jgi:hypothetical protein
VELSPNLNSAGDPAGPLPPRSDAPAPSETERHIDIKV